MCLIACLICVCTGNSQNFWVPTPEYRRRGRPGSSMLQAASGGVVCSMKATLGSMRSAQSHPPSLM